MSSSSHRRILLYVIIAVVMALSGFALKSIKLSEDIQPLLPDGTSDAAIDFRLLAAGSLYAKSRRLTSGRTPGLTGRPL